MRGKERVQDKIARLVRELRGRYLGGAQAYSGVGGGVRGEAEGGSADGGADGGGEEGKAAVEKAEKGGSGGGEEKRPSESGSGDEQRGEGSGREVASWMRAEAAKLRGGRRLSGRVTRMREG